MQTRTPFTTQCSLTYRLVKLLVPFLDTINELLRKLNAYNVHGVWVRANFPNAPGMMLMVYHGDNPSWPEGGTLHRICVRTPMLESSTTGGRLKLRNKARRKEVEIEFAPWQGYVLGADLMSAGKVGAIKTWSLCKGGEAGVEGLCVSRPSMLASFVGCCS